MKKQQVKEYNKKYPSYNITNIKKMTQGELDMRANGNQSLNDVYACYSDYKRKSFEKILKTYNPTILGIQGSSHAYSVLLKADNGDTLHITRDNNYLVEVK